MQLTRREFLTLTAAGVAGATADSCIQLTPRYCKPEPLTRREELLSLSNASVVDVRTATILPQHTLLLRHGKILEVYHPERASIVHPDREIDLAGAYVLPGLINAHCHMTLPGAIGFGVTFLAAYKRQLERNCEQCITRGITTVRDMLAISDFLDELTAKIALGDIVGPRILRCCAMDIRGSYGDKMSLFAKNRYWRLVDTPEQAREHVRAALEQGADCIKLFQQPKELFLPGKQLPVMPTPVIAAIQDEADRYGKMVALHHTTLSGLLKGLEAGVRSFEHMVTDASVPEHAVQSLLYNQCYLVPTASVAFALAYERKGDPHWGKGFTLRIAHERPKVLPDLIRTFCEPELVPSTIRFFEKLSTPRSFESFHLLPWPDPSTMNAAADTGAHNTSALYEAGVMFGVGNDGGVPLIFPGALGLELVLLEEQGLKPPDLLRMATINNAQLLQIDKDLGTVEAGKIADLVVCKDNPLTTMRTLQAPLMVFQSGELVYRSNGKGI